MYLTPWGAWFQSWSLFREAKMACLKPPGTFWMESNTNISTQNMRDQRWNRALQGQEAHGKAKILFRLAHHHPPNSVSKTAFCVRDPVTWKPGNHRLQSTPQHTAAHAFNSFKIRPKWQQIEQGLGPHRILPASLPPLQQHDEAYRQGGKVY